MSYYVVKNKYSIPGFVFVTVASWIVVLGGLTIFMIANWAISATAHFDLINSLHGPLRFVLNLSGAYAAFGGFCLYMTMWVYWIAVERGSISARIGWFLALLVPIYGALIYAIVVWWTDVEKVIGPQPIRGSSVAS